MVKTILETLITYILFLPRLVIQRTTIDHSGVYTCFIKNRAGSVYANATVIVGGKYVLLYFEICSIVSQLCFN